MTTTICHCGRPVPCVKHAPKATAPARPARLSAADLGMPSLFDPAPSDPLPVRADDPPTSVKAARSSRLRAGSQKARLLVQYAAHEGGLTDEQAAERAGLIGPIGACWWHRCSDLRKDGFIEPTGTERLASSGEYRMVCVITDAGRAAVEAMR